MTYIKYFWGFDSSVEGWTGDNLQWEDGGVGGLPTPHIKTYMSHYQYGGTYSPTITIKSPRGLNIKSGDILCFVFTIDYSYKITGQHISIEVLDNSDNVLWSKSINISGAYKNTPYICIVKLGSDGVGINIKIAGTLYGSTFWGTYSLTFRVDSVTIYQQPDQVIHTPIPSTLQATITHEIPINRSGAFVVGALRLDPIQNLSTYDEKLIYDGSSEYDYADTLTTAKTTTKSVDKITITHCADSTLQVYYECEHAVWILDSNTYYPIWLAIIKCYHNQNITNPDTLSFSTILNGTNTYSKTQSMSLKFTANGLFNLNITPSAEVIGDTTGITSLTATIVIKDSNGNVIGTCNYDILNNKYDQAIVIDKSYDNQDLTIEITINADGQVSVTVTVKLKLNFKFTY